MERPERPRSLIAKLFGVLVVAAVVASVIGTLAATGRLGTASRGAGGSNVSLIGTPRVISTLAAAQLLCPTGASFSPDGSRLAVIGTSTTCYNTHLSSSLDVLHELAIFDGHYATLLHVIPLDPLVGRERQSTPNEERIRALRYVGLGWTPDGKRVAVAYTAFDSASDTTFSHVIDSGLLLIAADAGVVQATIQGDAGFFGTSPIFPVWNVATKTVVTPPRAPRPGLTYTWSADGQLDPLNALGSTPLSQLPASAGARYPVGNPDGDSTFSIWQPGILVGAGTADVGQGSDAFVTAFPTWSSNSTYTTIMVGGVGIPGPSAAGTDTTAPPGPLAYPMPSVLPRVPARDAAMAAVAAQVGTSGWALLAWNPNGSYLASINCKSATDATIQIRDTRTGNVAGSAPVRLGRVDVGCYDLGGGEDLGNYPNPSLWMQWTPDGSQVLVTDQRTGSLILWSVQQPAPSGA